MPRMMRTYSREEIAAMEPGDTRFCLASDAEAAIVSLRKENRKLRSKLREETGRRKDSEQWICTGNVPDESPDDRARSEWGIFG